MKHAPDFGLLALKSDVYQANITTGKAATSEPNSLTPTASKLYIAVAGAVVIVFVCFLWWWWWLWGLVLAHLVNAGQAGPAWVDTDLHGRKLSIPRAPSKYIEHSYFGADDTYFGAYSFYK